MASLLDGSRYHALVFGAGACLAAWTDFSFLGHVRAQQVGLLVIDDQGLVGAKLAKFGFGKKSAVSTAGFAATRVATFFTHGLLQKTKTGIHLPPWQSHYRRR